jgi:regulatory protein
MSPRLIKSDSDLSAEEERAALARARHDLERLLRYRPRSRYEAEQRLEQKGHGAETISEVIAEAERRGWLNDETFAKLWIADRLLSKPKSARALRRELTAKGVSKETIERELTKVDLDEGILARELAEQRWARYADLEPLERERKLAAFLMRRGFAPPLVRATLHQLAADHHEVGEI